MAPLRHLICPKGPAIPGLQTSAGSVEPNPETLHKWLSKIYLLIEPLPWRFRLIATRTADACALLYCQTSRSAVCTFTLLVAAE